jgi:hypothetical protein
MVIMGPKDFNHNLLLTDLQAYLNKVFGDVKDIDAHAELPEDFNDCMVALLGDVIEEGKPPIRSVNTSHIQQLTLIRTFVSKKKCINSWIFELTKHGFLLTVNLYTFYSFYAN